MFSGLGLSYMYIHGLFLEMQCFEWLLKYLQILSCWVYQCCRFIRFLKLSDVCLECDQVYRVKPEYKLWYREIGNSPVALIQLTLRLMDTNRTQVYFLFLDNICQFALLNL